MKKIITILIVSSVLSLVLVSTGICKYNKLAQTGMKFLSISTDARASALGDAFTAVDGNSLSMFYNPSTMANMRGLTNIALGQINWIADIKYAFGSLALSPKNGTYGVWGISVLSVNYGDFVGTVRDASDQGFAETGLFSPSAISIGVGYAKALSSKFSVGANIKLVKQDLGNSVIGVNDDGSYEEKGYNETVTAYDFGVLYRTGFESLNFGMCIRNFSREVTYEDEGFQLPLTFKIGVSMNIFDLYQPLNTRYHSLLLSIDAVHPRDYPEQLNIGAEYLFMKTFALRAGYSSPNDEHGLSAGVGFTQSLANFMLALDYSYTPFDLFEDVHRFSLQFSF